MPNYLFLVAFLKRVAVVAVANIRRALLLSVSVTAANFHEFRACLQELIVRSLEDSFDRHLGVRRMALLGLLSCHFNAGSSLTSRTGWFVLDFSHCGLVVALVVGIAKRPTSITKQIFTVSRLDKSRV